MAGIASVIMGLTIGGIAGALAGGVGGRVDTVIMRVTDVFLAIPGILLAIGIVAWLGSGLPQIMFAVAMTNAPIFARILRGQHAVAARVRLRASRPDPWGRASGRLLVRHLLPNSLTPLIVAATLALATAIIDVAGLGFLGLGHPGPADARVGDHAQRRREGAPPGPVAAVLPGRRDRGHRGRVQPARRRPARVARPADEAVTDGPADRPRAEPLLQVRDLRRPVPDPRRRRSTRSTASRFELARGERLGLVGESGCGKSVTNLAIIRLLPKPAGRIEGGQVLFDGVDLVTMSESDVREIRGRDIAMIFQDPMTSLNPVLTIEEQMVETIQAHRKVDTADGAQPGGRAARDGRDPAGRSGASRRTRTSSRAGCASA